MTTEGDIIDMSENGHRGCMLCGKRNPRSLGLSFRATGDGGIAARFDAKDLFQGYDGMIHGGVISALLDEAMTYCLFHHGIEGITGDLHVRFVHPVPCGVSLEVRAWPLLFRRPVYRLRSEIVLGERVMAWGEAKFMRRESSG